MKIWRSLEGERYFLFLAEPTYKHETCGSCGNEHGNDSSWVQKGPDLDGAGDELCEPSAKVLAPALKGLKANDVVELTLSVSGVFEPVVD